MKYLKIFAFSLGALLVTSCCEENKSFNTEAGVSVDMADSQITVKESEGQFFVPIKVDGKANGDVKVTVKVEGTGNNPAQPFEEHNGEWSGNFILVSSTLTISPDQGEASLEFSTVDDFNINYDRTFTVTIVSAEGAKVGTQNSTLVTLEDNDSDPYERIQGNYKVNCFDMNGTARMFNISVKGVAKSSPYYGVLLNVTGLTSACEPIFVGDGSSMQAAFEVDPETGAPMLYLLMPQDIGKCTYADDLRIWALNGYSTAQAEVPGILSDDGRTISFPEGSMILFYAASADFSTQLGGFGAISDFSFAR